LKNKLTVILPLKERPEFTKIWLENNYNEYYEYIIADGSHSEKNKEIFLNFKKKNIKYLRFKPDTNYRDYYKKMYDCSLLVKTDFVIQSDNDDYLNYQGISKIINTLIKKNRNVGSGYISHIIKKKNLFRHINFTNNIDYYIKNSKKEIFENFFNNYTPLFYSVCSTKIFNKIYYNIVRSDVHFLSNFEYLFSLLAIKYGDITKVNTNHYIRLINTFDNSNLEYKKNKIIKKDYEIDFLKIKKNIFTNKRNYPKDFINQISIKTFNRGNNSKKKTYLFNFFALFLKKIFHPYLKINTLRAYLYFYTKLL
jgi:glycosyltransferase domain-containing protein